MLRQVPKSLSIPALLLLVAPLSACVGSTLIRPPVLNCGAFIPDDWRKPVPGAEFPAVETIGGWITFGDAQTGQLDKANDRGQATNHIIDKCDQENQKILGDLKPRKFLGIF